MVGWDLAPDQTAALLNQAVLHAQSVKKVTFVNFINKPGLWKYHARLVRPGPISFRTS